MLWPRDKYDVAYEQLKQDSLGGGCTVLIFVAPDVDAVCAARILTFILRTDNVSYKLKPVSGYGDLRQANEKLVLESEEIRSVVLLNCGGIADLREMMQLRPEVKCYVVDSHRPIHLSNIHGDEQVVFFDDGSQEVEYPSDVDIDDSDEDSDDDDSEEDEEDEDEEDGTHEHEFGVEEGTSGARGDQDTATSGPKDEDEDMSPAGKRKREREMKREMRAEQRQRRRKVQEYYYIGSFYGAPASSLMYELAQQVNKDSNQILWLAIVGATEQFLLQRSDVDAYNQLVVFFQQEVLTKNTEGQKETEAADGTLIPNGEGGGIWFEFEYRFFCHRHWSLYDSMYHSSYVASRLGIWRADGKDKLQRFLAKMGFSLKQCRQNFKFMHTDLKSKLRDKLEECAEEFNLEDFSYGSFYRQQGYKSFVSAADVVYSTAALLEIGHAQKADGEASGWEERFNIAYDSLAAGQRDSKKHLERGLKHSMTMQQSIVHQANQLMERSSITRLKHFRYCYLKNLPDGDRTLFAKPMILSKLAQFLVEAYRESGRWAGKKGRPFVMLSFNESNDTYMVVGVTCPQQIGDILPNKFGNAFRFAAEAINARVKHDGFETSVMEVDKVDAQRFIESLHNTMDA